MITLDLHDPQWMGEPTDAAMDQCAHGSVEFSVDNVTFVSVADGQWTVSAAALFLLRTIECDHNSEHSVSNGNQLFPCCGFGVYPTTDEEFPIVVIGCPNGIDPEIHHDGNRIEISLGSLTASATRRDWVTSVLGFVGQVEDFYKRSESKQVPDDIQEQVAWKAFWREWKEAKLAAMSL